jgi:hypothetical protein
MIPSQNSSRVLVALLAAAVFLVRTAARCEGHSWLPSRWHSRPWSPPQDSSQQPSISPGHSPHSLRGQCPIPTGDGASD